MGDELGWVSFEQVRGVFQRRLRLDHRRGTLRGVDDGHGQPRPGDLRDGPCERERLTATGVVGVPHQNVLPDHDGTIPPRGRVNATLAGPGIATGGAIRRRLATGGVAAAPCRRS
jgi:hypothetical protein